MQATSDQALFQPTQIGRMQLAHRIVMAPMTRYRADTDHVHGDLGVKYYSQRASVRGTLLISEGAAISPGAVGFDSVPGIYTEKQIAGWKRITDAVHAKGSFIYLQLWTTGRTANVDILERKGFPLVSASNIPKAGGEVPRPLTIPEIQQYVRDYSQAARNAVRAGFDGVEIHAAYGALVDQFLQDVSNKRTDEYGGSIEARSKFGLEVVKGVVDAIGEDRTGIRLSPWNIYHSMGMENPVPQFLHFIRSLRENYPNLAYVHLVEAGHDPQSDGSKSNDVFRKEWAPRPFLSASGHTLESAMKNSAEKKDIIVFGRDFLANPDLPRRLKDGISLNAYDYKTFYTPQTAIGYTDYGFAAEIATEA